jgi:DNA polymerase III subunit beta
MTSTEIVTSPGIKVSCSREELVQKLSIVSRGVSTRTAVQILSGIQLRAEEGTLELAATDMELSVRTSLEAQVEGAGTTVVPGRLLAELSRLLPEGDVDLVAAEDSVLKITCGPASYTLHTYAAEDFPRLPEVEESALFAVDRDAFLDTVARVSRAASRDESRPVLTGILIRYEPGKLVMAATDSYRLAVKETPGETDARELEALVPARALAEVQRLAPVGEPLELGVLENQVVFALGGTTLTTRRIDGQFPNYKALLPESFENEVMLPREELLDVVRRTSVMAQRNSPLRLRFGEGELTVTARTPDVGEAQESMPVSFSGEPLEIGFNAEFLKDGVESVEGEELRLKLISPLRPAVLQGADDDFTYLIMPIRLAG